MLSILRKKTLLLVVALSEDQDVLLKMAAYFVKFPWQHVETQPSYEVS